MPTEQAWIVRMKTGGGDVVDKGLRENRLFLGWSGAEGLVDCDDYLEFREIIKKAHYKSEPDYRRAGHAAGVLWRFVHEMQPGDLVVVPHPWEFYVGELAAGPAEYQSEAWEDDTAHRRPVRWLNGAKPIPRSNARSALISRMRSQSTLTDASDLIAEITEALGTVAQDGPPMLLESLRRQLIETTKRELLTGHIDDRRFEQLVRDLLMALGAVSARIVPRRHDIGADIEVDFPVGQLMTVPVRVQVKYWRGEAGPEPIDQLLNALDDVGIGVVVSTATFSAAAIDYAAEREEATGKKLILVDGDGLSSLIVEHGLSGLLASDDFVT